MQGEVSGGSPGEKTWLAFCFLFTQPFSSHLFLFALYCACDVCSYLYLSVSYLCLYISSIGTDCNLIFLPKISPFSLSYSLSDYLPTGTETNHKQYLPILLTLHLTMAIESKICHCNQFSALTSFYCCPNPSQS